MSRDSNDAPGLLGVLRRPDILRQLDAAAWEPLLQQADMSRLLGRLIHEADQRGVPEGPPAWLADRIASARAFARDTERAVAWEVRRLKRALLTYPHRWVLLKGGAYVAAGLPPARGRRVADIDVLVPATGLGEAEAALHAHGWTSPPLDPYDERYYREWMHEIPPLVHQRRRSVVDLHHAILPRTSRLRPDTGRLLAAAVPANGVHVLCPAHMVVHAAVHLFHDGEIGGALRDLVDLDALFRYFDTAVVDFWPTLAAESSTLGVERPVYYALRYSERLLGTPVPASLAAERRRWAPPAPVLRLMDGLVHRTLDPGGGSRTAAFGLLARSQWLRMPPWLLARHLVHKATGR